MTDVLADTPITEHELGDLRLDPENPRLHRFTLEEGLLDEPAMVEALLARFDPEPVGRSIVEFGFFATEPLIVFPEGGAYVVAEGNRRLVALKLLLDPLLREAVEAGDEWNRLAAALQTHPERVSRLTTIPCQEVPDRRAAAPIIGYRHIVGILKWDAFEKSAFVVKLLEDDPTRGFEQVGELVGESPRRIQRRFRDWLVLKQAEEAGVRIAEAQAEFGRWERAMNAKGVREYIGARSPTVMQPASDTAYDAPSEQMAKLLSFLYGEPGGPDRLFTDTRKIDELSVALQTDDGVRILETDRDLERAFEAAGGRRDFVLKGLAKALTGLQQAATDYPEHAADEAVQMAILAIREQLDQLQVGVVADGATAEGPEEFELVDEDDGDDVEFGEEDDDDSEGVPT
ncbi:MAG: hypothetical protein QOH12_1118 [Solirubrobacteraceae bacterium]|nr:hypothetical protein [Solirubrobacteraceae bacterium]